MVGICALDLPAAVVPLWQVEQIPVTGGTAVEWLKVVAHVVVDKWQVSHWDVVGTCVLGLPVAVEPLWQDEQFPATGGTAVKWLNPAVAHDVVEVWQASHCAEVETWVVGLPVAATPLWHELQRPTAGGESTLWSNVAIVQVVVDLWQLSHD